MKLRLPMAMVLLASFSACKQPDSVVFADVAIGSKLAPLYSIRVAMSSAQTHDTKVYPATPSSTPLPSSASLVIVLPRSRTGVLDLAFEGLDLDGTSVLAHGTARTTIVVGSNATASVSLVAGPSLCGNGVVDPGDTCDDGNQFSFDGCDFRCQNENAQDDAGAPDGLPWNAKDTFLALDLAPDSATPDAPYSADLALDLKGTPFKVIFSKISWN